MKIRHLNNRASLTAIGLALAVSGFAAPAHAQTTPAAGLIAGDAGTNEDNFIIVTDQKREQNLQEVPVAINVIDTESLDQYDVKNFGEVSRISPSVSMAKRHQLRPVRFTYQQAGRLWPRQFQPRHSGAGWPL